MQGNVDAVVVGVGSGGTLTGIGRYMAKNSPKTRMILADPVGSVLAPLVETGRQPEAGSWAVEGIGEDFVPPNADLKLVHKAYAISDPDSFAAARDLLRHEGVLAGSSTGTLLAAALRYCREQSEPKRVVSLVCDSGAKYLSKVFNPAVRSPRRAGTSERRGQVRDVVTSRFPKAKRSWCIPTTRCAPPSCACAPPISRNCPWSTANASSASSTRATCSARVLEHSSRAFEHPVKDVMVTRLETISADAPIADLVPLFRSDLVAIVLDGGHFLGIAHAPRSHQLFSHCEMN